MDKLDKEIKTKLYREINEETTEEDMINIVSKNPVHFFMDSRFYENANVIQATIETLNQKEEYLEEFISLLKNTDNKQLSYEIVLNNPHMIEYVSQNDSICTLALFKDYTCYDKILKPTWVMQNFVLNMIKTGKELGTVIILEI
jgi:hypothetical protein